MQTSEQTGDLRLKAAMLRQHALGLVANACFSAFAYHGTFGRGCRILADLILMLFC